MTLFTWSANGRSKKKDRKDSKEFERKCQALKKASNNGPYEVCTFILLLLLKNYVIGTR